MFETPNGEIRLKKKGKAGTKIVVRKPSIGLNPKIRNSVKTGDWQLLRQYIDQYRNAIVDSTVDNKPRTYEQLKHASSGLFAHISKMERELI